MTEKNERRRHDGGSHHGSRHHSHHSGRRHSLKRRLKRWLRRHKWAGIAALMLVVVLAATAFWMRRDMQSRLRYQVSSGHNVDVGGGYQDITYNGRAYRYNNRVTAILYAGIDSDTPIRELGVYASAPRADSISLVVMDELNECITIIALSRDTMTDIRKYTLDGYSRGFYRDHLGYAYTYGDGGKASCKNLCEAVSKLLFDIPICGYVVSNRQSLTLLGDAIGPVEVTVPTNDLAEHGFAEGEIVVIDSGNLEEFVRSRDTAADLSNVGRMARQQAYIEGAIDKIVELLTTDATYVWGIVDQAEDSVLTDITRSRYLDLTKVLKHTAYSQGNYYIPEGEQVVGDVYDEFYPDEEALHQKVIELFYIEQ